MTTKDLTRSDITLSLDSHSSRLEYLNEIGFFPRMAHPTEGEMTLVLDKGEALLRPGSVVIQRGTNHAWANRSGKVCRMLFVLVSGRYDPVIAAFLKDTP